MPFISLSEAKSAYFMSGEATNEIYIFSLHLMKYFKCRNLSKTLNFPFIIHNFKRGLFFALNDGIHVRALRYINDDVT